MSTCTMATWLNLKSSGPSSSRPQGVVGLPRITRISRKQANEIELDFNQDARWVIGEILKNVCRKDGITKGRRLAYLNVFVKYLQHVQRKSGQELNLGYSVEEIILCLRTCLVNEAAVIRCAALRALRYLIQSDQDVLVVIATGLPFLIVRSLDYVLNNSGERMQAARFCQRLLAIGNGAENFPSTITRALVSIGFDGLIDGDKLHKASLSILCQLAILNPDHFIENGGVRVLLHNVLGCQSPMVMEAILGSLLHLLNVPETRDAAGVNLHALVAPLTDLHFKFSSHALSDKSLDERELGYRCAKTAIGFVLRSWSGLINFCQSENSGLQALIDALYIEQLEIRRTILDLICEIIGLKFPTWTDEVKVALSAVDPSYPQESWKLQEGFVVQEALVVLPHLALNTPNITANHKALLVFSFARRGLLDALVEVIVTSDTFISVRATVLLGELLSLVDQFLPVECFDPSQCIPSLIRHSMTESPRFQNATSNSQFSTSATAQLRQHRALEAISALTALRKIKAKFPTPHSVFLQLQLQFSGFGSKHHNKFVDRLGQVQLGRVIKKEIESSPGKILKESGVVTSKDPFSWQWDLICTLIRWVPSSLRKVDDSSWRTFLRRLVDFYKPSNKIFARLEVIKGQSYAQIGCYLMEFLADESQNFSRTTLLEELLGDIAVHLDELLQNFKNPHKSFFSPSRLETTASQNYFLFLGKLSQSPKGVKMLERQEILRRLMDLVREMSHDYYVKLIVSSLYYGEEYCRRILGAALMSSLESARLYATQFLRVLVRSKLSDFSKWGIELLVNQLGDKSRAVSLAAMDILEEAIHDKMFLESLIALRPTLTHLGDRGVLLLICFLSLPSGYKFLMEANFLRTEVDKWQRSFNKRYVELVEVLVRDSVSTLKRGEDGKYPERSSRFTEASRFVDIYVPPHLYGQLAQHKPGLDLLLEIGNIPGLSVIVLSMKCDTVEMTRELKAALWALGHFATSADALPIIEDNGVLEAMVHLAENCSILSVRHTAFHCLCLICCTQPGAESLRKFGWYAMPRSHHEIYPIWGTLCSPEKHLKPRNTFPELDMDLEMEQLENASLNSRTEIGSHILEGDSDSLRYFSMFDESDKLLVQIDENPPTANGEISEMGGVSKAEVSSAAARKISYAHHRSQSDSQALVAKKSNGEDVVVEEDEDEVDHADDTSNRETLMSTSVGKSGPFGSLKGRVSSILSGNTGTGTSISSGSNFWLSTLGSSGSFRWKRHRSRSDSVTESITSGVSSSDSSSVSKQTGPVFGTDHVQTLSPIPSSASIATTVQSNQASISNLSPPSRDTSRALTDPGIRLGSPSYIYRSMIRKPTIRMSILSDPDMYPYSHKRSGSIREMKAGSLDRHFMLSPRDLFNESKLLRGNSSMTSLSTPSFRTRPEVETRGPCFMGLCLPKDFSMLFLAGSESTKSFRSESTSAESVVLNTMDTEAVFEFHKPENCLGCIQLREPKSFPEEVVKSMDSLAVVDNTEGNRNSMVSIGSLISGGSSMDSNDKRRIIPDSSHGKSLLRKEILRLVSNMISCVGAKANEQGLLRLKQKFPRAFHDLCLYSELLGVMSAYNVRLLLRRFVQELFFDGPFEQFYLTAEKILYPELEFSMSASTTTTDTSESTVIELPIGTIAEAIGEVVEDTTPCPSPSDEGDSDSYIDLK